MEINKIQSNKNDRQIVSKLGSTLVAMARLFKRNVKKKFGTLVKDAIIIEGIVEITNGDTHIIANNSVVNQGLAALVSIMSISGMLPNTSPAQFWLGAGNGSMRVGQDTVTPTQSTTTLLSAPIGAGLGTIPNSQTISNSNPVAGQWQVTYTSLWNAGTVSGTLGEVGLFLFIWTAAQGLQPAGGANVAPTTHTMFSRMASADGKFVSFAINAAVPLAISWVIRFTYAV